MTQKCHLDIYKKVMPNIISSYQKVVHYNPKFFRRKKKNNSKNTEIKNIYFLAQAIVPLSLKGRLHILNMLIKIAEKFKTKNIIIKLRHLEDENSNHMHKEKQIIVLHVHLRRD